MLKCHRRRCLQLTFELCHKICTNNTIISMSIIYIYVLILLDCHECVIIITILPMCFGKRWNCKLLRILLLNNNNNNNKTVQL